MDEVTRVKDVTTTVTMPPEVSALMRQEAEETGNSFTSIIRRRVLDSYRREAQRQNDEAQPATAGVS